MQHRAQPPARRRLAAAAALVCASVLAVATPAAAKDPTGERIGGANRYDTAALIAPYTAFECGVAVANGRSFPDGLAGAVLSKKLLLTETNELPAETIAELERTDELCERVVIHVLGGTAAVSPAVFKRLHDYVQTGSDIARLGGANRYGTALAVAEHAAAAFGDPDRVVEDTVLLTTGANFPDALTAGPVVARHRYPILLNDGEALRGDVAGFLTAKGVRRVFILGGTAAVPASIEEELRDLGIEADRLGGTDRYETAVAIATRFPLSAGTCALLVNGNAFPDALAAGALGGNARVQRCPVVLVSRDRVPPATREWLVANAPQKVTAIGGIGVITDAVLAEAMSPTNPPAIITSATVTNTRFRQALFRVAGDALTIGADPGSAADGPFGNTWSIAFVDDPDPANSTVAVDGADTAFTMTAPFAAGLSYADFVDIWNSSPAARLTTARTTTPAARFTGPPGDLDTPMGLGAANSALTLTFDKPIVDPTPLALGEGAVFADSRGAAPVIVDLARARTQAFDTATGTTVTFEWLNAVEPIARTGDQLRILSGTIVDQTARPSPALTSPITAP